MNYNIIDVLVKNAQGKNYIASLIKINSRTEIK